MNMEDMKDALDSFLRKWQSESPTLSVRTSGSTGVPKVIEVEKDRMRASAQMTCDYLGLKEGDTALLCMPLQYIAGMMMVVRTAERGMKLVCVEPSNRPLRTLCKKSKDVMDTPITFAAMVPSQVYETLKHKEEKEMLKRIPVLIIGGGAIDADLERTLTTFPNQIYSTYGMTETLSHIALRRMGTPFYSPLPGVSLAQTPEGCLVIDAPSVCPTTLVTHDIVEFAEESKTPHFRIIGRSDNTICSGGIKIQIEEMEATLRPVFGNTIQVTSVPDHKFGEAVVLLTTLPLDEQKLQDTLTNHYWRPKHIILIDELPLTGTGKPDRAKAKEIAVQRI